MKNNWLLWARYIILNTVGFVGLALLYASGYVQQVIDGDASNISIVIFCLFLIGLVITGTRIFNLSKEINLLKAGLSDQLEEYTNLVKHKNEEAARQAIEIKLHARIHWIEYIASSLVSLGLIGTVYGTIVFMLGIDLAAIGDIDQVGRVFSVVFYGMGIALYTTLTGAVFNLWLKFNYAIVEHGTAHFLAELIGTETE
ncbi:MAG: MotA/TolQ/ExbB proton channel family protein [Candidatus Kariarchaeaceae archaeon]|jgi:hypothetical protein